MAVAILDQHAIDLHDVRLQLGHAGESGIAAGEIVERDLEAVAAVFGDDGVDMGERGEPHVLLLDDLEGDAVERKAGARGGLQRAPDAGGRRVDRVRQEVDVQAAAVVEAMDAEPGRQLDRLHPAGLVEGVAVLLGQLAEHERGPLARRPAHQRLIGVDPPLRQIDHRLERHGEGEDLGPLRTGVAWGVGWWGCGHGGLRGRGGAGGPGG